MLKTFLLVMIFLFSTTHLKAREPYHATVTVDTISELVTAPNLVDLSRDLKTSSLEDLITIYTPVSAVSFDINLRGILALASFAANSTTLVVEIPQAGITQTYTGGTRDESILLFKDSLRDGGPRHRLFKAYHKYSPIDPIAGNPNSLQAGMADSDYLLASLYPFKGCDCSCNTQPSVHYFQGGLRFQRGFSKGFETSTATLPFRYSYSPQCASAFIVDVPITYIKDGGASSLFGSVGMGLQIPVTQKWYLTPVIRLGTGGSVDLCTAGSFASAGLSSVYYLPFRSHVIAVTNYASFSSSTNLWVSGINCTYHLHNYIYKNGISLTSCEGVCICKRVFNYRISFIDTYFAHDRLYINHYDEIGVSLLVNYVNSRLRYDSLTLGFAYQFGEKNFRGYTGNLVYQF